MIRKLIYTALFASTSLGLFAQRLTDEQIQERRRRASEDVITKVISYPSEPNDSSIHVNRTLQYQTMSPEALMQNVFARSGACLSIENVRTRVYGWDTGTGTAVGNNGTAWTSNGTGVRGLAYFHKGNSNFPMTEGLVMSTADVRMVEGPNIGDFYLNGGSIFTGDSDLQKLIDGFPTLSGTPTVREVKNVTVIEFDFIPTGSTVEFKYIFGSEEYPEFVGDRYNDIFGFFVKEKYSASDPVNIAKLPATDNPPWDIISVNNVNNGYWEDYTYTSRSYPPHPDAVIPTNSRFFVPQPVGTRATELDGYVYDTLEDKALVASFSGMTPCATYTMKLAIGNVYDVQQGSAVFLEANSLIMGTDMIVYSNGNRGVERIYKGCDNNYFHITNTEPVPVTVNLAYRGELNNGTDYTQLNGTPLPTTVTIPANSSYDLYFKATSTAQAGQYFEILQLCPCDPLGDTVTATRIYVYGNTGPNVTIAKTVGVTTGTITVTATGSSGIYEYSIDNGATWVDTNVFTGLPINTTYQVKTRDKWSCHEVTHAVSLFGATSIPVNPHIMSRYGN